MFFNRRSNYFYRDYPPVPYYTNTAPELHTHVGGASKAGGAELTRSVSVRSNRERSSSRGSRKSNRKQSIQKEQAQQEQLHKQGVAGREDASSLEGAGADFTPYGYVSRPGSTPASYSLWGGSSSHSTSSTSSSRQYRRHFSRSLCRVVMCCAAVLILMAVMGIVGIAVYLGVITKEPDGNEFRLGYSGRLEVRGGDAWLPDLASSSSPAFRAKAAKYQSMLEKVYGNSILSPSLEGAPVLGFDPGPTESIDRSGSSRGFGLNFRVILDRRKVPGHIINIEQAVRETLVQELISLAPVAFRGADVDIDSLIISREAATTVTSYGASSTQPPPVAPVAKIVVEDHQERHRAPTLSLEEEGSDDEYKYIKAPGGAIIRVKSRPSTGRGSVGSLSPILVPRTPKIPATTPKSTTTTSTTTPEPSSTVSNLHLQRGSWKPVVHPFQDQNDPLNELPPIVDLSSVIEHPVPENVQKMLDIIRKESATRDDLEAVARMDEDILLESVNVDRGRFNNEGFRYKATPAEVRVRERQTPDAVKKLPERIAVYYDAEGNVYPAAEAPLPTLIRSENHEKRVRPGILNDKRFPVGSSSSDKPAGMIPIWGENGEYFYYYDDLNNQSNPDYSDNNYYDYAYPILEEDKIANLRLDEVPIVEVPEANMIREGFFFDGEEPVDSPNTREGTTVVPLDHLPTTLIASVPTTGPHFGRPPFPLSVYPSQKYLSNRPLRLPTSRDSTILRTRPILDTFVTRRPTRRRPITSMNHDGNIADFNTFRNVEGDENDLLKKATMSAFDQAHIRTTKSTTPVASTTFPPTTTPSTTSSTTTTTTPPPTTTTTTPPTTTTITTTTPATTTTMSTPQTTTTTTTTTPEPTTTVTPAKPTTKKTPTRHEIENLLLDLLALSSSPQELSETFLGNFKGDQIRHERRPHSHEHGIFYKDEAPPRRKQEIPLKETVNADVNSDVDYFYRNDYPEAAEEYNYYDSPSESVIGAALNFGDNMNQEENQPQENGIRRQSSVEPMKGPEDIAVKSQQTEDYSEIENIDVRNPGPNVQSSEVPISNNENGKDLNEVNFEEMLRKRQQEQYEKLQQQYELQQRLYQEMLLNFNHNKTNVISDPGKAGDRPGETEMPRAESNGRQPETKTSLSPEDRLVTFHNVNSNQYEDGKLVTFHDVTPNEEGLLTLREPGLYSIPYNNDPKINQPLVQFVNNEAVARPETLFINNHETSPHKIYINNQEIEDPIDALTVIPVVPKPTETPGSIRTTLSEDTEKLSLSDSLSILREVGIKTPEQLLDALQNELFAFRAGSSSSGGSSQREDPLTTPSSERDYPVPAYDYVNQMDSGNVDSASGQEEYDNRDNYDNASLEKATNDVKTKENFPGKGLLDSLLSGAHSLWYPNALISNSSSSETVTPSATRDQSTNPVTSNLSQLSDPSITIAQSHGLPNIRNVQSLPNKPGALDNFIKMQQQTFGPNTQVVAFQDPDDPSRLIAFQTVVGSGQALTSQQSQMLLENRLGLYDPTQASGANLIPDKLAVKAISESSFADSTFSTPPSVKIQNSTNSYFSSNFGEDNKNLSREKLLQLQIEQHKQQQLLLQQRQSQVLQNQYLIDQAQSLLKNTASPDPQDIFLPGDLFSHMNPIPLASSHPPVSPDSFPVPPPASWIPDIPMVSSPPPSTTRELTIWDFLTTRKPLVLNTEVITSVSSNVEYKHKGTTKKQQLGPVYVPSRPTTPSPHHTDPYFGFLTVPVITAGHVDFVRVNSSRKSYPKVVIVNTNPTRNSAASTTPMTPVLRSNANEARGSGGGLSSFSFSTEHLDKLVRTLIGIEDQPSIPDETVESTTSKTLSTLGSTQSTVLLSTAIDQESGTSTLEYKNDAHEIVISDSLDTIDAESVLNSLERNLPEDMLPKSTSDFLDYGTTANESPDAHNFTVGINQTTITGANSEMSIFEVVKDLSERYLSEPEMVEQLQNFHRVKSEERQQKSLESQMITGAVNEYSDLVSPSQTEIGQPSITLEASPASGQPSITLDDLRQALLSMTDEYTSLNGTDGTGYSQDGTWTPTDQNGNTQNVDYYSYNYDASNSYSGGSNQGSDVSTSDYSTDYSTGNFGTSNVDPNTTLNQDESLVDYSNTQTLEPSTSENQAFLESIQRNPYLSQGTKQQNSADLNLDYNIHIPNDDYYNNFPEALQNFAELKNNASHDSGQDLEVSLTNINSTSGASSPLNEQKSNTNLTDTAHQEFMDLNAFKEDLAYLDSLRDELLKSIEVNKPVNQLDDSQNFQKRTLDTNSNLASDLDDSQALHKQIIDTNKPLRLTLDREKLLQYMSETEVFGQHQQQEHPVLRSRRAAQPFRQGIFREANPLQTAETSFANNYPGFDTYNPEVFSAYSNRRVYNSKLLRHQNHNPQGEPFKNNENFYGSSVDSDAFYSKKDEPITVYITTEDFKIERDDKVDISSRSHGLSSTTDSPVHTFVLRQGQSLHDLLQEIFKKLIEEEKNGKFGSSDSKTYNEESSHVEELRSGGSGVEEIDSNVFGIERSEYDGSKGYISASTADEVSPTIPATSTPSMVSETRLKDKNIIHLSTVIEDTGDKMPIVEISSSASAKNDDRSRADDSLTATAIDEAIFPEVTFLPEVSTSSTRTILLDDVVTQNLGDPRNASSYDGNPVNLKTISDPKPSDVTDAVNRIVLSHLNSTGQTGSYSGNFPIFGGGIRPVKGPGILPHILSGFRYTTRRPSTATEIKSSKTAAALNTTLTSSTTTTTTTTTTSTTTSAPSSTASTTETSSTFPASNVKTTKMPAMTQEEFMKIYNGLFLTSTTQAPINRTSHPELFQLFPVMTRPMNRFKNKIDGAQTTESLDGATVAPDATSSDSSVESEKVPISSDDTIPINKNLKPESSESLSTHSLVQSSLERSDLAPSNLKPTLGSTEDTEIVPPLFTRPPMKVITSMDVSVRMHTFDGLNETFSNSTKECTWPGYRSCRNGECIQATSFCNMVVDCEDETDEQSCTCADFLRSQFLGRKICDEIIDCWDLTDESNCEWCRPGQFICSGSRQCVDQKHVCDGNVDCPMGDDEVNCVTIAPDEDAAQSLQYYDEGYLMVRREGRWGKLCMDNFKDVFTGPTLGRNIGGHRDDEVEANSVYNVQNLGESVCRTLSYRTFTNVESLQDPQQSLLSRLATHSFGPTSYFEISIGDDPQVSARTRRSQSSIQFNAEWSPSSWNSGFSPSSLFEGEHRISRISRSAGGGIGEVDTTEDATTVKPKRTLAAILSAAGFGFTMREVVPEDTTTPNKVFKRSTSGDGLISADDYYGQGYAVGFGYTSSDPVTVDGRTAAVGQSYLPSDNSHHHLTHSSFSQGQKIKHSPLRYGGTFYGGESATTRSPFRYTPKHPSVGFSTTDAPPVAVSSSPTFLENKNSTTETTTRSSLYTQNTADHYGYLYDKDHEKSTTTLYQLSHNEKANSNLHKLVKSHTTTNIPYHNIKHTSKPLKLSTKLSLKGSSSSQSSTILLKQEVHSSSSQSHTSTPSAETKAVPTEPNPGFTTVTYAMETSSSQSHGVFLPAPTGNLGARITPHEFPDLRTSLNFQSTTCPKKDVVKLTCGDLECGVRPKALSSRARIVGGSNSSPGSWPWQAALYKEGEYQCGASLVAEQWLVSAGHCFYGSTDQHWVARLGALRRGSTLASPYEQLRTISHIFIHPDYIDASYTNDVSLLKLDSPVRFTDFVRPVCLPPPDYRVQTGRRCTLIGWGQLFEVGKIFPDSLQEVDVPLISTEECQRRTLFIPLYRITVNMFCAGYLSGGRDACLGDSGGPLMCQELDGHWVLAGVTSNGYGCARPNRPGVYTKVAAYRGWIQQILTLSHNQQVVPMRPAACDGFRCPLGTCLPVSSVCDGHADCSDGSDETGCRRGKVYSRENKVMEDTASTRTR